MSCSFVRPVLAGVVALIASFGVAPACASALSYVSGKGRDVGDCASTANPCRSLQYAFGQTTTGGEIKALDPADYFPVAIDRSITITGVAGAGILRGRAGDAISIDAGSGAIISLSRFDLNGLGIATNGIRVTKASEVKIFDCVIRRFANAGVFATPLANSRLDLTVADSEVSDNGRAIDLSPPTGSTINAALDGVMLARNASGLNVDLSTTVIVTNSAVLRNAGFGLKATNGAILRLGRTVVSGNGVGVDVVAGAATISYRDNNIDGNIIDLSNPMSTTPMK